MTGRASILQVVKIIFRRMTGGTVPVWLLVSHRIWCLGRLPCWQRGVLMALVPGWSRRVPVGLMRRPTMAVSGCLIHG